MVFLTQACALIERHAPPSSAYRAAKDKTVSRPVVGAGNVRRAALHLEAVDAILKALQEDYRTAPISEQDQVMLDYVAQLTRDATRVSRQDHERLRAIGFNDRAILQITLIASWFNYINRVADGLGVGRE